MYFLQRYSHILQAFLILFFFAFFYSPNLQSQGLIVNEISQGASGGKEFAEFVVVGPACTTVDLQGWIVDDNNGDFTDCLGPDNGALSGTGIAEGHIRFKYDPIWAAVPVGTIILLYADNPNLPSDQADIGNLSLSAPDYEDLDCDFLRLIPVNESNTYIERSSLNPHTPNSSNSADNTVCPNGGNPTAEGSPFYTPATYLPLADNTFLGNFQFNNTGDACQVREPDGTYFHGFAYGNSSGGSPSIMGGPDGLYLSANGTNKNYYFDNTTSDTYTDVNNFADGTATTDQTPGRANSCANAQWIESLRTAPDNEFQGASCPSTGTPITLCAGTQTTVALTGNCDSNDYLWTIDNGNAIIIGSDDQKSVTIQGVSDGNATLSVTATNTHTDLFTGLVGCSPTPQDDLYSFNLTINAPALPIIIGNDFCEGDNSTLSLNNAYSQYNWSNGDTNPTTDVGTSGTYTVTITDGNGCTATDGIIINENPNPLVDIENNSNTTSPLIGCENVFIHLSASLSGSFPPYNHIWSNGSTNAGITLDGLVEGSGTYTYTVTVTDGNSCSTTDEATIVFLPFPTFSVPTINVCEDNPGSGTASGIDLTQYNNLINNSSSHGIVWYNGDITSGIPISNPNNVSLPTSNNTLSVDVVNNLTNCISLVNIPFNILSTPSFTISGDDFCTGSNSTLAVVESFSGYTWSTGSQTQSIVVNVQGTYTVTVTNADNCTATDEITINENPNLNPTANGNDFCAGTSSTLSVGEVYAFYTWSTGGTTQDISVSIPGTYTVTVENASGCEGTVQVTVGELPALNPTISSSDFCSGGSSTLSVNESFNSYNWSNNAVGQNISVNITGTYTVTVTTANGCTGTTQTTVNELTLSALSLSGSDFCSGQNNTLSVDQSFNAYNWSNGGSSQNNIVNTAGTYTVTVTQGNGCTQTDETTINQFLSPNPNATGTDFCTGKSTTLSVVQNYSTYNWSDTQSGKNITVSNSGTYNVTVSDANNCTGFTNVTVNELALPNPSISGIDFCSGGSTQLSVNESFDQYNWSTNANTQNITIFSGATYTVTVTNTDNCTATADITINVFSITPPNLTSNNLCQGSVSPLIVVEDYNSYEWSNGDSGKNVFASIAGTYTVTVTTNQGCTSSGQITIQDSPSPNPVIDGENLCNGEEANLSLTESYVLYIWSNNETTQNITVNTAGTYTVTVVSSNGCSNTADFTVNPVSNPEPDIEGNLNFCEGTNTSISVAQTYTEYKWSTNSSSQGITVSAGGLYIVTVTDTNGCSADIGAWVSEKPLPTVTLSTNSPICSGEDAILTFDLIGTAPWSLTYFNGFNNVTTNITSSPYIVNIPTSQSINVSLNSVSDVFCSSNLFESSEIVLNEIPTVSNIVATCNGTNTGYTLSFDISGGDFNTYNVTGGGGNLVGNTFTSNLIPSGDSYNFTIDDGNLCGPLPLNGSNDCNCSTFAGTMPIEAIEVCENENINLNNNGDENLDANDLLQYILHDNTGTSIGTVFAQNNTGSFSFTDAVPPLQYNTTYYISSIAGNDDNSGNIDLTDECFSVAGGTPISFLQIPTPTTEAGGSTCENNWDLVAFPSIGTGTWSADPSDGVTFGGENNSNTTATITNSGNYTFYWTEDNGGCVAEALVEVTFIENVVVNAGEDDEICNNEYDLVADSEGTVGIWTANPAVGIEFTNENDPTTRVTITDVGLYTFTWTVDNGDCTVSDEVEITFYDGIGIINRSHECIDNEFVVSFEIIGGEGDYLVNGGTEGLAGNVFTSSPITSGEEYTFTIADGSPCFNFTIIDDFFCNCTTNAGQLPFNTIERCGFDASIEVTAASSILDNNDILVYVLHDGTLPLNILISNTNGQFAFNEAILDYDTEYFITALAGNDNDGDGFPDPEDDCYETSNDTPLIFYAQPTVSITNDCGLTQSLTALQQTSTGTNNWSGTGTWTYSTNGSGSVDFVDANNPNSDGTATTAGDYTFYWTGGGGCIDSIEITFVEGISASWSALCSTDLLTYTVTLTIEGGEMPYTVNATPIVGTSYMETFNAADGFSFDIDDSSDCESINLSDTWDCDCPSPDDPAPTNVLVSYCNGTLIPDLSVADNGVDTYFWYNDPSDAVAIFEGNVFSPSTAGTAAYWVQAVSAANCVSNFVSIDLVENPSPDNPIGGNQAYCQGDVLPELSVTDNGVDTYFWFADTTATSILEGNALTPPSTGTATYWVQATSPDNCTSDFVEIQLTENPKPDNPIGDNQAYCEDDALPNLSVTDNGVDTYFWFTDTTTTSIFEGNTLSPPSAGTATYWVQAISPDNCTSDFVEIQLIENTSPDNPIGNNEAYCEDNALPNLSVTDNGVDTYFWFTDTTTTSIFEGNTLSPPSAGTATYWVQAQSSNECVSLFVPIELTENELPPMPIVTDETLCLGVTLSNPIAASTTNGTLNWLADTGASGTGSFDGSGFAVGEHTITVFEESEAICEGASSSFVLTIENCNQSCPTVTSAPTANFEHCGTANQALSIAIDDPDNTLDRIEWILDNTVVTTDVMALSVNEIPTGCNPTVLEYTVNIYCSLNPNTPILAGTFGLTFYPEADATINILNGGCTIEAVPTCPNFSMVGNSTETTTTDGDTNEVTFTVQNDDTILDNNCSTVIAANFNCIITDCPTLASISPANTVCTGEDIALSATISDPNGKLDRIEWLDDSGALLSSNFDFVHSVIVNGCDAQTFTYTFQIYCNDDPTTPSSSNTVEWTVYPTPDNVVEVGGCSLEVLDVDCGGNLMINYSDDNGTTWQSSPNASPTDGEVWLWQALVTGAPDGCNLEGNVTAICNCTPPSTPIAVSSLSIEICTDEVVPAFEVMLNDGDFVQWYDVETGGEPIGQGFTFMASEAGIYYAEVGNDADDCVSERLAFELTINPLDDANFTYASTDFCLGDINILSPDFVASAGGSFSADGGLVVDALTGAFDLNTISQIGTYNITYTTPEPCSSSQSIAIEVGNNELVLDAGEDIEVCESQEISLAATLEGIAGLQWSMDGLGSFEDPLNLITNFISPNTGQFTLYLTASNDCGDDLLDSLQLTVLPSFTLDVEGNRNIFVGETTHLEAIGEENLELIWFSNGDENSLSCLDCPNPTASPDTTTTYFVTSNEVCADTASATVVVSEREVIRLAVENAFSPNGDGINDEFRVFINAPMEEYHLMIFNRWGEKVFESQDPEEAWNGTHNDELQPIGVYAYVIRYQFAGQNTKQLSQNVTIIR